MAGDGLRVFHGEFLVLPAPLELSGNWCSHGCSYCFANAAKPDRQLDLKNVMALLRNYHERNGLEAKLLQRQYPVNISNHVDPFSNSNWKQFVPIMRLLTDLNIPIYFQTRGGNEQAIAETLDFIKPSVFYVSITHQSDESRQIVEPNAPTVEHRYELIKELKSRGHRVLVGLNPLVPEWMPDLEAVIGQLKTLGVEGLWIEALHLNRYQKAGMKAWQQKRLGENLIKKAMKHNTDEAHEVHFMAARTIATKMGMPVMTAGQPNHSTFFDCFHETYENTFPTIQDFVNYCITENVQIVTWEIWKNFFYPWLPKVGETPGHMDYLRQAVHRELSSVPYLTTRKSKRFNYGTVLQYSYRDDRLSKLPFSPFNQASLAPVKDDGQLLYFDGNGGAHKDRTKGYPVFYFDETGQTKDVALGVS